MHSPHRHTYTYHIVRGIIIRQHGTRHKFTYVTVNFRVLLKLETNLWKSLLTKKHVNKLKTYGPIIKWIQFWSTNSFISACSFHTTSFPVAVVHDKMILWFLITPLTNVPPSFLPKQFHVFIPSFWLRICVIFVIISWPYHFFTSRCKSYIPHQAITSFMLKSMKIT